MSAYTYLLVLADHSKFKVGITNNLVDRLCSFTFRPRQVPKTFDLSMSVAVQLATKSGARDLEGSALHRFKRWATPTPWYVIEGPNGLRQESPCIRYGAGGHDEWLDGKVVSAAVDFLRVAGTSQARPLVSLAETFEEHFRDKPTPPCKRACHPFIYPGRPSSAKEARAIASKFFE